MRIVIADIVLKFTDKLIRKVSDINQSLFLHARRRSDPLPGEHLLEKYLVLCQANNYNLCQGQARVQSHFMGPSALPNTLL